MLHTLRRLTLLSLLSSPWCHAAPITHFFSITDTTGPLAGQTSQGSFSYDSSIIVPDSTIQQTGLLTMLDFTWNSIHYDETSANTGTMIFDSNGALRRTIFGTNCSAGSCTVSVSTPGSWYAFLFTPQPSPGTQNFFYSTPQAIFGARATLLAQPVPEPATLPTLAAGLALLSLVSIRPFRR